MFWGLSDSFQQPFLVVCTPSTLGVASGLLLPVDLIQLVDSKIKKIKKNEEHLLTQGATLGMLVEVLNTTSVFNF